MHVDPHLLARFPNATLEQIADAQHSADLRGTLLRSFKRSDRRMRSHVDSLNLRKLGGDFIRHSITEISAVWLRTQVLQGKDANGRLGGYSCGLRWRMFLMPRGAPNGDQQSQRGGNRENDSASRSRARLSLRVRGRSSPRVRGPLDALQVRAQLGRGLVAHLPGLFPATFRERARTRRATPDSIAAQEQGPGSESHRRSPRYSRHKKAKRLSSSRTRRLRMRTSPSSSLA